MSSDSFCLSFSSISPMQLIFIMYSISLSYQQECRREEVKKGEKVVRLKQYYERFMCYIFIL